MVKIVRAAKKKSNKSDIDKQIKLEKLRASNLKKKLKRPKKKIGISYRKNLSSNLMRQFGGDGRTSQQQGKRPVGRPRGEFKHRDPETGQPIPATQFYKRLKEVRRKAQQQSQTEDIRQIQQLAKKGIPPEQAKQIVDRRQLQSVGIQSQPQQQQLTPEQIRQLIIQKQLQEQQKNNVFASKVPSNLPRYGRRGEFIEGDAFGNPKVKVYGDEKSFWN